MYIGTYLFSSMTNDFPDMALSMYFSITTTHLAYHRTSTTRLTSSRQVTFPYRSISLSKLSYSRSAIFERGMSFENCRKPRLLIKARGEAAPGHWTSNPFPPLGSFYLWRLYFNADSRWGYCEKVGWGHEEDWVVTHARGRQVAKPVRLLDQLQITPSCLIIDRKEKI